MRGIRWLLLCFVLLSFLVGCGSGGAATDGVGSHHHVARTGGGAVVLSFDEHIAVATNRSAGVVTVLTLNPERGLDKLVTKTQVVQTGEGSEPWAAVIGADDNTAYVILRKPQTVVRIDDLRGKATLSDERVAVGSEPSGIAITPTGKVLFVANWGEGTISKIDTQPFVHRRFLSVNDDLVAAGTLGGVKSRPGLAHPRALTITDNGDQDDDDEVLFATEFFSQPLPSATAADAANDTNRQGLVYSVRVGTGQAGPTIPISPVQDTGFPDSDGNRTGCFPNQLSAATTNGDRLFVTATCTSPRGPLDKVTTDTTNNANYKTLFHPAVFAVDTQALEERPAEGHLLTQVLAGFADQTDDAPDVRMPLLPNDIAFGLGIDGMPSAYVLALGADAVFRLDYAPDHSLTGIGSPGHRFVAGLPDQGYAIGFAPSRRASPSFGLALSDTAQLISVVDLAHEKQAGLRVPTATGVAYAQDVFSSAANQGRGLFATGRGIWSFKGQAWSSCESCHPGGLSDGVTWYFSRGPRRTLSPANTYAKQPDATGKRARRLLLWGANVDEIHDIEAIVRTVSGGAGAILWKYPPNELTSNACRIVYDGKGPQSDNAAFCGQSKPSTQLLNGLNGSLSSIVADKGGCNTDDVNCDSAGTPNWNQIDAFISSLRVPKPPTNLDPNHVSAGRKVFEASGCMNCHAGPQWTLSTRFYEPGPDANGVAPAQKPAQPPPLGWLRQNLYTVPQALAALNPAANLSTRTDCPTDFKCATARVGPTDNQDETALNLIYSMSADDAAKAAGNEQIRCALRDVGTFPVQPVDTTTHNFEGIGPVGVHHPLEYRQDMKTIAQGQNGFSIPSLFGLAEGAPFLHAGNARTLEELFDSAFASHYKNPAGEFDPNASAEDFSNLIEFLLSIDETVPPEVAGADFDFCARSIAVHAP